MQTERFVGTREQRCGFCDLFRVVRVSDCDCDCKPNGIARAGPFQRHSPLDARFLMNGMGLSCEAMAMRTVAWRLLAARLRMLLVGLLPVTG